jgi:hypothetical protein
MVIVLLNVIPYQTNSLLEEIYAHHDTFETFFILPVIWHFSVFLITELFPPCLVVGKHTFMLVFVIFQDKLIYI